MNDFWGKMWSQLKTDAYGNTDPHYGFRKAKWEGITDAAADYAGGAAARYGIPLGLYFGAQAVLSNPSMVDPKFASIAAGVGIGGAIGGYAGWSGMRLLSKLAQSSNSNIAFGGKFLDNKLGRWFKNTLAKDGIMAKGSAGVGAAALGVVGASIGAGVGIANNYDVNPAIGALAPLGVVGGAIGLAALGRGTLHGAAKTIGSNFLGGTASMLGAAGAVAYSGLRAAEYGARAFFTGGIAARGVPGNMLDAWFPFFRHEKAILNPSDVLKANPGLKASDLPDKKYFNPRKFAPNPSIIRRSVAAAAIGGLAQGVNELTNPMVAPPTAFFDGRHMRHINDMGAGAGYGMGILGRNSSLNMGYQDFQRIAAAAL